MRIGCCLLQARLLMFCLDVLFVRAGVVVCCMCCSISLGLAFLVVDCAVVVCVGRFCCLMSVGCVGCLLLVVADVVAFSSVPLCFAS